VCTITVRALSGMELAFILWKEGAGKIPVSVSTKAAALARISVCSPEGYREGAAARGLASGKVLKIMLDVSQVDRPSWPPRSRAQPGIQRDRSRRDNPARLRPSGNRQRSPNIGPAPGVRQILRGT